MDDFAYILANTSNVTICTWVTKDLIRRVYEHKNHSDPQAFTERYTVDNLVYFETTTSFTAAIERENRTNPGPAPERTI